MLPVVVGRLGGGERPDGTLSNNSKHCEKKTGTVMKPPFQGKALCLIYCFILLFALSYFATLLYSLYPCHPGEALVLNGTKSEFPLMLMYYPSSRTPPSVLAAFKRARTAFFSNLTTPRRPAEVNKSAARAVGQCFILMGNNFLRKNSLLSLISAESI